MRNLIRKWLRVLQSRPTLVALLLLVTAVVGVLMIGLSATAGEVVPTPTSAIPTTLTPGPAPSIQLSLEEVEPGALVFIAGDGWRPGDTVSIYVEPTSDAQESPQPLTVATVTVTEDGTFVTAFNFPGGAPWTGMPRALVVARSSETDDNASALLEIINATLTATPTPTSTSTPTSTPTPLTLPSTDTPVPPSPTPTSMPTAPPTPTPTSTPTPVISGWRGEYFSNARLAGAPALIRDDTAIDFDWDVSSPAAGLPSDGFSVRWTRDLFFQPGTYRFYALSDDGVRVWLDEVLIVDEWHDASGVTYTAERELNAGVHALRVEYYENSGQSEIHFWWERVTGFPQWRGEYYSNTNLTGSPALVRNDAVLDFNWGSNAPASGLPADHFSVRWTRTLAFESGQYRFHAVVDDGVRLWVDDQLIIDAWQTGAVREVTADRTLSTGNHDLRVEYYELEGQALIRVWWEKVAHYPNWKGEYWSNRTLSGDPDLVRNDVTINYDWELDAPATGLPADNFSVRWTRTDNFDAATYRFYVVVDDGARLWIDDQLIIDSWHDGAARELTADHPLSQGAHGLRVEFYEHTGIARIQVWWEKVLNPSYPDWKGEYWSNRDLSGDPTLVRNDEAIDFSWGTGAPALGLPVDDFSARWSRRINFESGVYRFYAQADDGIRLYVDGHLTLDEWHISTGEEVYTADVPLRGEHQLVVEYYERGGEALVRLWWNWVEDWPTPTPTRTLTSTPTPTSTPTKAPTSTPTPVPTSTLPPTPEPTSTPTSTPRPMATPTLKPTLSSTPKPTATPTVAPTATPTLKPTLSPTPEPTATPTVAPTATPTLKPTLPPTPEPTATPAPRPTAAPLETPESMPIGVRLNEILPVPAAVDWDGNGVANDRDEWIEIRNAAPGPIDISGWTLDSGPNGTSYVFPQGTILGPNTFPVFYRQETGIVLNDDGGVVRLLGPARFRRNIVPGVEAPPVDDRSGLPVVDIVTYGSLPPDASYSRGEGGAWHVGWPPSPGKPNLPPEGPEASIYSEPSLWGLFKRPGGTG